MEKRRRLSLKQWGKILLGTVVLVAVLALLMTQLTGGPSRRAVPPSDPPPEPMQEDVAEVSPQPAEEDQAEPVEETDSTPSVEKEPVGEVEPPSDPPQEPTREGEAGVAPQQQTEEAQTEPVEEAEPVPPAETESVEAVEPQPTEETPPEPVSSVETQSVEAVEPPSGPNLEVELRERLNERISKLEIALASMEVRRDQSTPETLTARMAASMIDSLEAEGREQEAATDMETAEAQEQPDNLLAALSDDKEQQAKVADLLIKEFQALKAKVNEQPQEPPTSHKGTTRVGRMLIEHRAPSVMPTEEGRRMLSAVSDNEAVYIRSLRWNGQAQATRDLWIGMGATYALLPPRRSFAPVYQIVGKLDGSALPEEVDQDSFFSRFSNRFTYLTTGDDASSVREIEARLIRKCGQCAGYKLTLVWNWETLTLILSDARALAREKGIRLPQDVKMIEWLAVPGSQAGRARVDVVRLVGRDGQIYAP